MPRDKSEDYCLVGSHLKCSQGWWICIHLGGSTSSGKDQGQQGQTFTPAASDTTAVPVEAHIAGQKRAGSDRQKECDSHCLTLPSAAHSL